MNIFLLILLIFSLFNKNETSREQKNLFVEIQKDGFNYTKDLIDFITENDKNINISHTKKKAVMVLGLSNTGKSTLINYLNNVPLICKRFNSKWIVEVNQKNLTLKTNIAEIGHGVFSTTFLPTAYTPLHEDFSYIDNPGFKDNRGISIEIVNGYFREKITSNLTDLKFLLLLEDHDLRYGKGQQFRDTLVTFSHFIGLFESNFDTIKATKLSNSIGIIITKVDESDFESDSQMKDELKNRLNSIVDSEIKIENLNRNQEIVFKTIIKNSQIEIFSNPRKNVILSTDQKLKILSLLKKMSFSKKEELNIKIRIDDSKNDLNSYVKTKYELFEEDFNNFIDLAISKYFRRKYEDFKEAPNLYHLLIGLRNKGLLENDFEDYLNIFSDEILDTKKKNELLSKKNAISFFNKFFVDKGQGHFPWKKSWTNKKIESKLNLLIEDLLIILRKKCNHFVFTLKESIKNGLDNTLEDKMMQANDMNEVEFILKNQTQFISKADNFEIFLEKLNQEILEKTFKEKLLKDKKGIFDFINSLPIDKRVEYLNSMSIQSIRGDLIIHLEKIKNQQKIRNIKTEIYNETNGEYIYKGFFAETDLVMQNINSQNKISNLKTVLIYAINSVKFDHDFLIRKERYIDDGPDLVIVAPKVTFNSIIINLSSEHIPDYPESKRKANDGTGYGGDGSDGKPGLPGYNGGNLFIISENISGAFKFISTGGIGGPGQEGGNGKSGRKGIDALYSDVKFDESNIYEKKTLKDNSLGHEEVFYFAFYGDAGTKGGNAGKAGHGGYNGFSGQYSIKNRTDRIMIKASDNSGVFGKNGSPGQIGLGGQYGDTAIRGYYKQKCGWLSWTGSALGAVLTAGAGSTLLAPCIVASYGFDNFEKKYDRMEQSHLYATNGKVDHNINTGGLINPKNKQQLNIKTRENEYLEYLLTSHYLKLMNNSDRFVNFILKTANDKSELSNFIERVKIFSISKNIKLHHYIDLKNEIFNYYSSTKEELSVLNYIKTAILGLISRYHSMHETNLVIDLEKFIELIIDQIKKRTELKNHVISNLSKLTYETSLKRKIKEANSLINALQNDMESSEKELNKVLTITLSEIFELKKQAKHKDSELQAKREQLEKTLFMKKIFSILKIGTNILSFSGPKGALLDSVTNAAIGLASEPTNVLPLSSEVVNAVQNYKNEMQIKKENNLKKIQNDIDTLEAQTNHRNIASKNLSISFEKRIQDLPDSSTKFELQLKYAETMMNDYSLNSETKSKLEKLEKEAKEKIETSKKNEKILDTINKAIQTAQLSVGLFEELKKHEDEIKQIENLANDNSENYAILNQMEKNIDDMQNVFIKQMQKEINSFIIDLNSSSLALLNFKKFQIKDQLNKMKSDISRLIANLNGQNELSNTINRIEYAILTMIEIYGYIERNVEQIEFTKYISIISKNQFIDIPEQFKDAIISLKKTIHENIIEERFQQAIYAFRHWSFPFNCQEELREQDCKEIDCKIKYYENHLEKILDHVKNQGTQLRLTDNYIKNQNFDKNIPFFKWSSKTHPYEIKRLLSGGDVTFYADVMFSNFDAVKFNKVYILIEAENSTINSTLNKLLGNLWLDLTHPKESFYRYKEKKYTVNTNSKPAEKIVLSYQYGNQENSNESFKKMANSRQAILSPYTFWNIKIKPVLSVQNALLKKLENLIHENTEFIVFLCGKGQYISNPNDNLTCENENN